MHRTGFNSALKNYKFRTIGCTLTENHVDMGNAEISMHGLSLLFFTFHTFFHTFLMFAIYDYNNLRFHLTSKSSPALLSNMNLLTVFLTTFDEKNNGQE